MQEIKVAVRTLPHFEGLPFPKYETEGAAGMDVRAAYAEGDRSVGCDP